MRASPLGIFFLQHITAGVVYGVWRTPDVCSYYCYYYSPRQRRCDITQILVMTYPSRFPTVVVPGITSPSRRRRIFPVHYRISPPSYQSSVPTTYIYAYTVPLFPSYRLPIKFAYHPQDCQ